MNKMMTGYRKNNDVYKDVEGYIYQGKSSLHGHNSNNSYTDNDKTIAHLYSGSYVEMGWVVSKVAQKEISNVEKQFLDLAEKWRKETSGLSTMIKIAGNDNYLDIIGMGEKVLPYIFKDLQKEPDYWFIALKHITKENPVKENSLGDIDKMTEDWLSWAKQKNII